MKTYNQITNKKSIDWNKVLENWNNLSTRDKAMYIQKSKSWVTCACGSLCSIIPRRYSNMPDDSILTHLGRKFTTAMMAEDIKSAKSILKKIEKRSNIVIKNTIKCDIKKYSEAGFKIKIYE